jgi:hypothetical protein
MGKSFIGKIYVIAVKAIEGIIIGKYTWSRFVCIGNLLDSVV